MGQQPLEDVVDCRLYTWVVGRRGGDRVDRLRWGDPGHSNMASAAAHRA